MNQRSTMQLLLASAFSLVMFMLKIESKQNYTIKAKRIQSNEKYMPRQVVLG